MAEMIFRIPSKAVQYGYVEIPFTFDSAPDAEMLAAHYVNYVYAFQKAEQDAIKAIQMDVSAPVAASQEASEESFQGAVETAQREAQRLLSEGLGGVTEVPEGEALDVGDDFAKDHPGAPWDKPQVDTPRKPWETGSADW